MIICAVLSMCILVSCDNSSIASDTTSSNQSSTGIFTEETEEPHPQGTTRPKETKPSITKLPITWDHSKYKVTITGSIPIYESFFGDEISVISPHPCDNEDHQALPEQFSHSEEITIFEERYVGEFYGVTCSYNCNVKAYRYKGTTASGIRFWFHLDENKNISYVSLYRGPQEDFQETITRVEAVRLAKSFYKEIVGEDIDKLGFRTEVKEHIGSGRGLLYYEVIFRLIKEGIIFEEITVSLLPNGELDDLSADDCSQIRRAELSGVDYDEVKYIFDQIYEYIDQLKHKNYECGDIYFRPHNGNTPSFSRTIGYEDGWLMHFTIIVEPIL